jgi:uncharacterized protein (DUF2384 family)
MLPEPIPERADEREAATLSKAVVRAAQLLRLRQSTLAGILGISAATASRLVAGKYRFHPSRRHEWEFALLFVRFFRALDAILGHGAQAQAWLHGPNTALGAAPVDLITKPQGLVRVVDYLDAFRGRL